MEEPKNMYIISLNVVNRKMQQNFKEKRTELYTGTGKRYKRKIASISRNYLHLKISIDE